MPELDPSAVHPLGHWLAHTRHLPACQLSTSAQPWRGDNPLYNAHARVHQGQLERASFDPNCNGGNVQASFSRLHLRYVWKGSNIFRRQNGGTQVIETKFVRASSHPCAFADCTASKCLRRVVCVLLASAFFTTSPRERFSRQEA
eukprot:4581801-Amphidinium_carterae.1